MVDARHSRRTDGTTLPAGPHISAGMATFAAKIPDFPERPDEDGFLCLFQSWSGEETCLWATSTRHSGSTSPAAALRALWSAATQALANLGDWCGSSSSEGSSWWLGDVYSEVLPGFHCAAIAQGRLVSGEPSGLAPCCCPALPPDNAEVAQSWRGGAVA